MPFDGSNDLILSSTISCDPWVEGGGFVTQEWIKYIRDLQGERKGLFKPFMMRQLKTLLQYEKNILSLAV